MFNLEKLKGYMQGEKEKKFLETLISTRRVVFDWGYHHLWVWPGDDEIPTLQEQCEDVEADSFHSHVFNGDCAKNWPTSAGLVVDLLSNGLAVQIAIEKLLTEEFIDELIKGAKEQNPEGEVGTITQYVPIYTEIVN